MERELPAPELKRYHNLGHTAKKEFRMRWAQGRYKELVKGSLHQEEWREIDEEKGTHLSISAAFREQGGTNADVTPTMKMVEHVTGWASPGYGGTGRLSATTYSC